MEERQAEVSPRALARIGGLLYLIIIGVGLFGEGFVHRPRSGHYALSSRGVVSAGQS
jgi:hypothetical protein